MSRRVPVLLTVAMILIAAAAGATTSRITALGESSAFYEDDRNVMRWYGSLVDYSDLLAIESGHFTFENGYKAPGGQTLSGPGAGGQFKIDDAEVWGTFGFYYHARGDDADPGSLHRGYLGSHTSFLWGKKLDEITIGILWRNAGETRTTWPNGDVIRGRQEAGFGIRYDLGERAYLDVSGETRRYTDRAEGTSGDGEAWKTPGHDSWNNYGFRARVFWGISQRLVLVPLIENITEDFSGTLVVTDGIEETSAHNQGDLWRFGAGLNFLRDPDNLLVISADYMKATVDHDIVPVDLDPVNTYRESYSVFLGKAALESRISHWLVGRFSVGYEHMDNSGDFTYPATESTLLISGGAGFHLVDFALDLALAGREPRGFSRYAPTLEREASELWSSLTLTWAF